MAVFLSLAPPPPLAAAEGCPPGAVTEVGVLEEGLEGGTWAFAADLPED